VGNAIVKALHLCRDVPYIITTDIAPLKVGLFRSDQSLIWPAVENEGSLDVIINSLRKVAANAVLIGSEYDLKFFADHRQQIEQETGACIVVSPPDIVTIANDKWETAKFLAAHNLPHAQTMLPDSLDEAIAAAEKLGWPVILKPRRGTAGRGVHRVTDADMMGMLFNKNSGQIVQEMLGSGGERLENEYTCSVFRLSDGTLLGPITARRSLRGGDSWSVEVDAFEFLYPVLLDIGQALHAIGPMNIQLIATDAGPVPFEINARFSGTTAIRAHFGFNEPDLALRHFVNGEAPEQPTIRRGLALRYMEEVFVDDYMSADLNMPLPAGKINSWF
jgi:carbamoyl-phosphate synthase large subunit